VTFEELAEQIKTGKIKAPFCGLCRGRADHTAIFVPPEHLALQLGLAAGKARLFIYGVCEACLKAHGMDGVSEQTEELILQQFRIH
jgi:hypothetical protein